MNKLFNISEASSIAIHCLGMLAKSNSPLNISVMSGKTDFSKNHMAKILQILAKHSYLGSSRGPSGGFFMLKKPSEINFLEIFELIEGKLSIPRCRIEDDTCPFETCIYGDKMNKLTEEFINYYETRTLEDFIKDESLEFRV